MQYKIRKHSDLLDIKHNLVAVAKKVWMIRDYNLKSSLLTRSQTQPPVFYCPKNIKAFLASFTDGRSYKKEIGEFYCNKSGYKEVQCQKNTRDVKKSRKTRLNSTRILVTFVIESNTIQHQAKNKNRTCRQWLVKALAD